MKLKIFSQSGDGRITSGCFADFGDIEPPKNMTPYNIVNSQSKCHSGKGVAVTMRNDCS